MLPVLDVFTGLLLTSPVRRPPGVTRAATLAARAERKRARRAAGLLGGVYAARMAVSAPARWLREASDLPRLPRPVSRIFAAATASTVGAVVWALTWPLANGGLPIYTRIEDSASGQRLAAALVMGHFLAWFGLACRRLNRDRAQAATWTPGATSPAIGRRRASVRHGRRGRP